MKPNQLRPAKTGADDERARARRDRVAHWLKKEGLDALIVSNPVNVAYLSGFSGDDATLLVARDKAWLISDPRFQDQVPTECPSVECVIRKPGVSMTLAQSTIAKPMRHVAVEADHLSVSNWNSLREQCPSVHFACSSGVIEELRAIKDADEIRRIRAAVRLAERTFETIRATWKPEDTEKTLADRVETTIRTLGGQCSSFPTIAAVDARAALPHAIPTGRALGDGEYLLLDWGAKAADYHSDLTRILPLRKLSRKFARVTAAVIEANEKAVQAIRPGVACGDVDAVARRCLEEHGFAKKFTHSLGHGIGREVHELPRLRRDERQILKPGMVVTVEPGVYIPGWGGARIEDDILVTRDGAETLSQLPRDPEELVEV